jgi:hypothetical protein
VRPVSAAGVATGPNALALMLCADRVPIVSTHSKMRRLKLVLPIPGTTLSALRRHALADSVKTWSSVSSMPLLAVPSPPWIAHRRFNAVSVLHFDAAEWAVAVGTEIALRPPHRSRRALLTHRAPTLDGDEEPLFGPRVQDAWERQVPVSDLLHSRPRESTSLASTHQRAVPTFDHVMPEC